MATKRIRTETERSSVRRRMRIHTPRVPTRQRPSVNRASDSIVRAANDLSAGDSRGRATSKRADQSMSNRFIHTLAKDTDCFNSTSPSLAYEIYL